jgi:glycerol-3-phosphate dehydrogenase (NAD(P)+)
MSKVAVVGFGAWGCALGTHAARQGHEVRAWAREQEVVDDVNTRHQNGPFLPGVALPPTIRASNDPGEVVTGAELVLLVPPSKHLRAVAAGIAPSVARNAVIAVASKGIEEGSLELMSEVLAEALPAVGKERVVFLSGPSFAKEVAAGLPTDVVAASTDARAAAFVQKELHTPMFRVYTRVISARPRAMSAARAFAPSPRPSQAPAAMAITFLTAPPTCTPIGSSLLGVALGADALTFLGMAGVGDLILTCTGALSRNRELGMKVAEGVDPRAYLASKRSVAEGFWTSAATHALASKRGVDMPITEQVYHVLHQGRPLLEALKMLVTRDFKGELVGIKREA